MAEAIDPLDVSAQLSSTYNNVSVLSTGNTLLAGHPAQFVNSIYSVGSPAGEVWARAFTITAATPGLIWTVSCGATAGSKSEAQKAYSRWQSELVRFPTNFKLQAK